MSLRKSSTWMARARRELARYLEEGISEVPPATGNSLVHHHNARDVYFDASRDRVALDAPYPLLPSLALPPGHAFAGRHANGTPLLVYRDKRDPTELRAYVNSCRHRGSPLLRQSRNLEEFATTPLKAPLLTCPYHAWTYDAQSGDLKKIPGHEKAFGLMDKEAFGLEALTCREQAGVVWVGGDQMRDNNLWSADELDTELEPFLYAPDSVPPEAFQTFGYRAWHVEANWQLVVETALESYHVKSLHSKTLSLVTHPTWAMASEHVDQGRNHIMTVPLKNFQPRDDFETESFLSQTTTMNLVFPYTFVGLYKRFLLVMAMEPVVGKNATLIRTWAVPHRFCNLDDENAGRDFYSIMAAGEEDWDCVEQIQNGLTNGSAAGEFCCGGYESNNVRFLNNIEQAAEQLKGVQ